KMASSNITMLLDEQQALGERIQSLIRNFKKDSDSRKTKPAYYTERLANLEGLWTNFASRDAKIRTILKGESSSHHYFINNYIIEIKNLVIEYQKIFNTKPAALKTETESIASTEEDLEIESMFREQRALIDSLESIMSKVTLDTCQHFEAIIFEYWNEIKNIHVQIHKKFQ
ncbi:hypothetical protein KR059_011932, partial [Drosophila kikkawai]